MADVTEDTVRDGDSRPPPRSLAVGDRLGTYRIDAFAGRGGMGVVYRAWDLTLDRPVAVKILPWAAVEPFRSRLRREARLAAALDHPNVVPVYGWGEDGDLVFIVMRFVEGTDLRALVDAEGPLAPQRAVRLLRQAASALDAAHAPEKGLLHRDVKPQNLLLADPGTDAEHLYLADFGLARSELTPADPELSYEPGAGTAAYMSPEQIRAEPLDARTDLYSLAAVAVFLLTGDPPFTGATPMEIAVAHLHDPVPAISGRVPGLPTAVDGVIAAGLAKDRRERPDSCRAFVSMLADALAGAAGTAPAGRSVLPMPLTSFIGRAADVAALRDRLTAERLVCLTGPGGVGKTRLALAALDGWSDAPPVTYVELAAVTDHGGVGSAVAAALRVTPGADPTAAVLERIGAERRLVVLDNCEHLLDGVASFLARLFAGCPRVRVLLTSRVPLNVAGECVVPVAPLAVPADGPYDAASLAAVPAVALFVARAMAAGAQPSLLGDSGASIAAICRRLDGVPLALELAARRARSMSLHEITKRLDDALGLLTDGDRTAPGRQRTLVATLEWTYGLLGRPEQAGFRALSVFAGGFDLDAAEVVLGGAGVVAARSIAEVVAGLTDWSLVARDPDVSGRYRLLETPREFGALLLIGDEARAVRAAHLTWCTHVADTCRRAQNSAAEQAGAERLDRELANIRIALRFAAGEDGPPGALLNLAAPFALCAVRRAPSLEARSWVEEALRRPGGEPEQRFAALRAAAAIAAGQGDSEAANRWATEALAGYESLADADGIAGCRLTLGFIASEGGDTAAAVAHWEAALRTAHDGDATVMEGKALNNLAIAAVYGEDLLRARAMLEQSLSLARRAQDRSGEGWTLSSLGLVALRLGEFDAARGYLDEAQAIQAGMAERRGLAHTRCNLATVALETGDLDGAHKLYLDALVMGHQDGLRPIVLEALEGISDVAAAGGDHTRAATLDGLAAAGREAAQLPTTPDLSSRHQARLDASRAELGPAEFAAARDGGARQDLDSVVTALIAERS